jgi:hypothetical protein
MSNKCVNYKFCKGVAFPELDIELCLLCDKWYEHGEGWGPLEFIENDDDCPVCYSNLRPIETITLGCNHQICRNCISSWFRTGSITCPYCRS